jgi:clan AA aspartic protease (TIGR02281 family)
MVTRGRQLARQADQHIRCLMGPPSPPVPGGATAAAAAAAAGPSRTVAAAMPADDSADVMSAGALSGNTTVCQAKVLANGREVDAVVDTGASHSVITRDLARKLGLQEEDNAKPVAFWNADGHLTSTTSIIRHIPVTIGPLTCKVDAFVTEAFNYDLLLGTDCLVPINATVCLKTRRLSFDLNTFTRSSVPITVSMSHAPSKYHYVNHTEVCEEENECDSHDKDDADDADDCSQLNQAEASPAATADCHEACT